MAPKENHERQHTLVVAGEQIGQQMLVLTERLSKATFDAVSRRRFAYIAPDRESDLKRHCLPRRIVRRYMVKQPDTPNRDGMNVITRSVE